MTAISYASFTLSVDAAGGEELVPNAGVICTITLPHPVLE